MTTKEQLVEQHIREYQSRLKHIDELYERAHDLTKQLDDNIPSRSELKDYDQQRALLRQKTDQIKTMEVSHWREETRKSAGPMAVWDILAQGLEDFIERHE